MNSLYITSAIPYVNGQRATCTPFAATLRSGTAGPVITSPWGLGGADHGQAVRAVAREEDEGAGDGAPFFVFAQSLQFALEQQLGSRLTVDLNAELALGSCSTTHGLHYVGIW